METYVILSRFASSAYQDPSEIRDLAQRVKDEIRRRCPQVEWRESYATSGSFDVVDIVQSESRVQVEQASRLIRAYGRCTTQVLPATPWKAFLDQV